MRNYSIDDLRAFCAAARVGQFLAAADSLYISASALSRRIANIESAVGGRLFERSTRRLQLTALGSAFFDRVAPLLAQMDTAYDEARRVAVGGPSRLSIAAVATVASTALPTVLPSFREQFPDIILSVRDGIATSIAGLVEQGQAEFGIATQLAFGTALDASRLGSYGYQLISRGPALKRTRRSVKWKELHGLQVVGLSPSSSTRMQIDAELSGHGIDLPWTVEVDQLSTMLTLVAHGQHCAVLPSLFNAAAAGLHSRPLVEPYFVRDLFMIKRVGGTLSAAASSLGSLLAASISL